MTALLSALGSGVGARKILEYLMRKSPELAPKISSALASGVTAEKILKWFSKGQNFDRLKGSMESEYPMQQNANPLVQAQNVRSQNLAPDLASGLQRQMPGILAGAGGLAAGMALKHALPNPLKDSIPETTEKSQGISQQPPIIPQGQPAPISPNIPQPQSPPQPEIKSIDVSKIINKHGFSKHIDEISKNVKDPKGVAAVLYNKFPKEMQAMQKEAGKPMEDVVSEYMGSKPEVEKNPEVPEIPKVEEKISPEIEKVEEKPIKIEKGSIAASPQGIGEIQAIRNGKAIIEVDGKKHQVDEDELIQSPLPEKDLAELYEELTRGIEKETGQEISRNVEYAAYSPENNELLYKPHSGGFYVYDDISPEIADELVNLLTERRSTGQNHIGAWTKGTKSIIGSRMYDLIKKLQSERGGKGNEYRAKYQTIYGALEPAQEAKKRAYEERKKKAKKPRPN